MLILIDYGVIMNKDKEGFWDSHDDEGDDI